MADAQLDLEVNLEGAEDAAKGLNGVAKQSADISKQATASASGVNVLSASVQGLSRGATAAAAAQQAWAQLMAGNFIGAARAATVAIKSLWAAMLSNPLTATLAVIGAVVAGIAIYANHVKKIAAELAQSAATSEGLYAKLMILRGGSARDRDAKNIQAMEESGDVKGLLEMRDKRREQAEDKRRKAEEAVNAIEGIKDPEERAAASDWANQKADDYADALTRAQDFQDAIDRIMEKEEADRAEAKAKADSEAKEREDARLSAEKEITAEKEKQAEAEARNAEKARRDREALEIRREEYRLSKLTNAEQLAAINAKISAIRQGPKTTDAENEMLDLMAKRDRLMAAENRAAGGGGAGDREADNSLAAASRRVVDGDDYSLKGFHPGRRRYRGMGDNSEGGARGRASAWASARTSAVFGAKGGAFTTSEMGRPMLDVKGVDQTNKLLEEIKERLA